MDNERGKELVHYEESYHTNHYQRREELWTMINRKLASSTINYIKAKLNLKKGIEVTQTTEEDYRRRTSS